MTDTRPTSAPAQPVRTATRQEHAPTAATPFDPDDYEWRPVLRRPRADGWTPDVQRRFIEVLADTGLVTDACREVDMSESSAYRLRRAPGAEGFARAWDAALATASGRLADLAFRRAIEGEDEPVFDRDGCRIGSKRRYNDRLMMFLLRAYRPEQFRHANLDTRGPNDPLPRRHPSVAQAMEALLPPVPPQPHTHMPPAQLEHWVDVAHGMADLYEDCPDLDRERFEEPAGPCDHPAAVGRRADRRKREAE